MVAWIKNKFEIGQIFKFLIGGGSAVLIDGIIYALLKQYIDITEAKTISYIVGAAAGFVINKLWTFESRRFEISEIFKYCMLYACSAAANTGVNRLVLWVVPCSILAFLCATGTSTVINFLGQKFFVFRNKAGRGE